MLISLDSECQESRTFERIYREFEAQKVCYLPINAFLLKPSQRLFHYQLIINSQLMLSSHCCSQLSICTLYCTIRVKIVRFWSVQRASKIFYNTLCVTAV